MPEKSYNAILVQPASDFDFLVFVLSPLIFYNRHQNIGVSMPDFGFQAPTALMH